MLGTRPVSYMGMIPGKGTFNFHIAMASLSSAKYPQGINRALNKALNKLIMPKKS